MREDEKKFFLLCLKYGRKSYGNYSDEYYTDVRDIIGILSDLDIMHHKRCWYLLEKWCRMGFYDYGVTLDLGWFYPTELPAQYRTLLEGGKV